MCKKRGFVLDTVFILSITFIRLYLKRKVHVKNHEKTVRKPWEVLSRLQPPLKRIQFFIKLRNGALALLSPRNVGLKSYLVFTVLSNINTDIGLLNF